MNRKRILTLLGSAVFVALLAVGGYWLVQRTEPNTCRICQRPIHAEARAVMEVSGQRESLCCVRCAITLVRQRRISVRVVEVTDFVSRRPLAPEAAYYVEGSDLVLCERHEPALDTEKQPLGRVFDRCAPSLYAFARREDAEAFAARNGGTLLRWFQVEKELAVQP